MGPIGERMDGWMDGWIDGWMDGWLTKVSVSVVKKHFHY